MLAIGNLANDLAGLCRGMDRRPRTDSPTSWVVTVKERVGHVRESVRRRVRDDVLEQGLDVGLIDGDSQTLL